MSNWQNRFWKNQAIVKTVLLDSLKQNERGIKKVYFVEDLGTTPAKCLRSTGECWIALKWWRKLPFEHKVFILLHENAHLALNSSNELLVDEYAHKQYMRMGFSLTESVKALTQVLSYNNEQHLERTKEQAVRAAVYDISKNKNKKLKNYLIKKSKTK